MPSRKFIESFAPKNLFGDPWDGWHKDADRTYKGGTVGIWGHGGYNKYVEKTGTRVKRYEREIKERRQDIEQYKKDIDELNGLNQKYFEVLQKIWERVGKEVMDRLRAWAEKNPEEDTDEWREKKEGYLKSIEMYKEEHAFSEQRKYEAGKARRLKEIEGIEEKIETLEKKIAKHQRYIGQKTGGMVVRRHSV